MIKTNQPLLRFIEQQVAANVPDNAIALRSMEAGKRFITQGEKSHEVYVIRSGIVKCFHSDEQGNDYILEFLGEGEMLGEVEAIRGLPPVVNIEAITPVTVYKMNHAQFRHFMQTIPELSWLVIGLLAARVADTSVKGARQQLYTVAELLPQLMHSLEAQQIAFTKQDLAGYLGVTLRSLNRALRDLEK